MPLLSRIIGILLAIDAYAAPHTPSHLPRTTVDSSSSLAINATITDHAGRDITSYFQIKIYIPPPTPSQPHNSSSNLHDRQTISSRAIDTCPLSTQAFISSACNEAPAIQSYTLVCAATTSVWQTPSGRSPIVSRSGRCTGDEICVNTVTRRRMMSRMVYVPTAMCVQQREFLLHTNPGQKYLNVGIDQAWDRLAASGSTSEPRNLGAQVVVSEGDAETPLEVDKLGVEVGGKRSVCRDCVSLKMRDVEVDTDSLKMEARMLTAGAVAGVVWLALMSG